MLSRAANTFIRKAPAVARTARTSAPMGSRFVGTLEEIPSAKTAWEKSCYFEMDFTIPEESHVFEAIQKFAAYDIGCLVTTDEDGKISGVISERDYISKMALLGRKSKETLVKEISTKSSNLMTATPHDSVDDCMEKMLSKDIRHLPLLDDDGHVVGMLSVKDLVKTMLQEKDETIKILSDFATGKGGHFGSD
eukprot:CAMPEP_0194073992 /NCGR_PEP_ID=MMETSP0149-20130528/1195_1 /TAXON_ID=122233 /ORGANISM="Chaetoceros debilis, Strain MM31A-1" /LENGTH=192 /DNA_ID=CAMNT_0038754067 /DNA_START=59 /DNA_END=637 /DNA_ORIENTATION=+